MRKHNGMRPQDVAILLKIIALNGQSWQLQTLSNALHISISEISDSLNRSRTAGLVDFHKKRPNRMAILEFLEFGVKYVFPQEPGAKAIGIPTAHSHPFMKSLINSDVNFVWPDQNGSVVGEAIEPFYKNQPQSAKEDPEFYKLLALVDVLRVGQVREINIAKEELKNSVLNG
jgi:hypothetical protein